MEAPEPSASHDLFADFGGVRRRVLAGTTRSAIREAASADITLESSSQQPPVDLAGEFALIVSTPEAGAAEAYDEVIFTGHVLSATPEAGQVRLRAESGRALAESRLGLFGHANVPPLELMHFLVRQGGLPEERVRIGGLDLTREETYSVEQFLQGVHVDGAVQGPDVDIAPVTPDLNPDDVLGHSLNKVSERWGRPSARVRTQVRATSIFAAYEAGMAKIEVALDSLLATAVYGLTEDPWGREIAFARETLLAKPVVIPFVAVAGVETPKRICVSSGTSSIETSFSVDGALERWSEILHKGPSDAVARGLRALRDAADESRDVFDRAHAISTALEYYAASSRPARVVSKKARTAAVDGLRKLDILDGERERLMALVNAVNNPPLMAKVRHQVNIDEVPVSEAEWALLRELRTLRNRTVHGHVPTQDIPDRGALRWAVSVTARLLLFRWAASITAAHSDR
ncbi:hypothetical protein H9L21_07630 [Aeromicrobium senzhongii]|uniref:Apea-like HEPN domain-containing protein n=1 Tax=Aeromicrobium senzhongii TaxID=2663859 RepID=A0ABX6SXL8_9ACTN|nr:hypothetical protein [Aeromicrobium senzhongii]MTB87165.1 hypothetical protein [Aeromicrobium senzhongii]QNL95756.1 hypothetical protein H9L21_07630 [Aeromicrobium senzhongii]